MRKIYLAFFLAGIVSAASAQTEKNDWMVGGRLELNTGKNSTHIGISPNAGMFFFKNFAAGANLEFDYIKTGDDKVTNFGIGPFARYYFTNHKARPLVHANVNYISSKLKTPQFTSTNTGSTLFLGGGLAYFINQNVSLEGLLGYSNTKYKDFEGSGGLRLSVGFQVYISRRQVEVMRGE